MRWQKFCLISLLVVFSHNSCLNPKELPRIEKCIPIHLLKMSNRKLPQAAIDTFARYYKQLANGENGLIPESQIEPIPKEQLYLWQSDGLPASVSRH